MEVRDSIVLIPTFSLSLKKLTNDEEGRGSLACKGTFENGEGRNGDVLLEFCIGTPITHPPLSNQKYCQSYVRNGVANFII